MFRGNRSETIESGILTFRRSPGQKKKEEMGPRVTSVCEMNSHVTFKANALLPLRREAVRYDQRSPVEEPEGRAQITSSWGDGLSVLSPRLVGCHGGLGPLWTE